MQILALLNRKVLSKYRLSETEKSFAIWTKRDLFYDFLKSSKFAAILVHHSH